MDFIAIAETLEAQAASLRREHARQAAAELPQLPLGDEWHDHDGSDAPVATYGKHVDVVYREGQRPGDTAPASVLSWTHDGGPHDIVEWRLSAEQSAE